jgi:putative nucleotidyltransferase with HDIG domain
LRRVASLVREIAARAGLGPADSAALAGSALLHHYPPEVLETETLSRLLGALRTGFPTGAASPFPSQAVRGVLERFHGTKSGDASSALAQIVEVANFFDERLEFLPFETMNVEQVFDELDWIARDGFLDPAVVALLAGLRQVHMQELVDQVQWLPVFPAVLLRALALTAEEDSSFSQIEEVVRTDQVLAGHLLRVANSALYGAIQRIASIRQAIARVGVDICRKVMMASAFQPLFVSTTLRELWQHSLVMARLTEGLAELCGRIDPHEAFLAGLVHDVGRLAFQKLRREYVSDYQRLVEGGCEPVFAELVLCGFEHGAAGAEILRSWSFPDPLIEAVQYHHRPEAGGSLLGAALYLAEDRSGSREDLVSPVRLSLAYDRLGIPLANPGGQGELADPGWLEFLVSPDGSPTVSSPGR